MKRPDDSLVHSRRRFLATVIPACSISCLGLKGVFAHADTVSGQVQEQADEHKFLKEYRTLSVRDYYRYRFKEYIDLAKGLSEIMGRDKILEHIKKTTHEQMLQLGRRQAEGVETGHFSSYIDMFRNPEFEKILTMEIVEDTEKAFEIKVTECINADAFLHYEAGDIGFARVCYGDYAWAEGYHPNIRLTRDKTLMEGHSYCNHRYTWVG